MGKLSVLLMQALLAILDSPLNKAGVVKVHIESLDTIPDASKCVDATGLGPHA